MLYTITIMATRRSCRSRKAVTRFNPDSAATKSKPRPRATTATTAAASSSSAPGAGRKAKPTKRSSTKESKPKPRRKRERSATPVRTKRTGSGLLFVFAHGAGASSQSDWMQEWAARLATVGTVHAFDYPCRCCAVGVPISPAPPPFAHTPGGRYEEWWPPPTC